MWLAPRRTYSDRHVPGVPLVEIVQRQIRDIRTPRLRKGNHSKQHGQHILHNQTKPFQSTPSALARTPVPTIRGLPVPGLPLPARGTRLNPDPATYHRRNVIRMFLCSQIGPLTYGLPAILLTAAGTSLGSLGRRVRVQLHELSKGNHEG